LSIIDRYYFFYKNFSWYFYCLYLLNGPYSLDRNLYRHLSNDLYYLLFLNRYLSHDLDYLLLLYRHLSYDLYYFLLLNYDLLILTFFIHCRWRNICDFLCFFNDYLDRDLNDSCLWLNQSLFFLYALQFYLRLSLDYDFCWDLNGQNSCGKVIIFLEIFINFFFN
jgi:hypothetical protein